MAQASTWSILAAEIFDPFFTTKAAGTGLGLAIVRKLKPTSTAAAVIVESDKGQGASVKVVLPRFIPPGRRLSSAADPRARTTPPTAALAATKATTAHRMAALKA